jgi:hypothetical protein
MMVIVNTYMVIEGGMAVPEGRWYNQCLHVCVLDALYWRDEFESMNSHMIPKH